MAETLDVIHSRRTIRKYTDQPISEETVTELLKTIEEAQSWNNVQCWEVVQIKSSSVREQILEAIPKKNPGFHALAKAPLVLVLCAKRGLSGAFGKGNYITKHGDWYMYDLGIATQNLCLAAHDMGLGTVVLGWFNHEIVEKVLGVPEGVEVVSIIPIGYRAQEGKKPKHKPIKEFLHIDGFGKSS